MSDVESDIEKSIEEPEESLEEEIQKEEDVNDQEESESEEEFTDDEDQYVSDFPITNHEKHRIRIRNPEDRMTSDTLTKTELARVLAITATRINNTGQAFIDIGKMTDPIKMAKKEIMEGKCPLILRRKVAEEKNKETGEIVYIVEDFDINYMKKPAIMDF